MVKKLQFRRGLKKDLPELELAEPGYSLDTKELHIGNGNRTYATFIDEFQTASLLEALETTSETFKTAVKPAVTEKIKINGVATPLTVKANEQGIMSLNDYALMASYQNLPFLLNTSYELLDWQDFESGGEPIIIPNGQEAWLKTLTLKGQTKVLEKGSKKSLQDMALCLACNDNFLPIQGPEVLRSLDTFCDTWTLQADGTQESRRLIQVQTLTGASQELWSLDVQHSTEQWAVFRLPLADLASSKTPLVLSAAYPTETEWLTEQAHLLTDGQALIWVIEAEQAANVKALRAFLKQNPLTFHYVLKEPEVTLETTPLFIFTQQGLNQITVQSEVAPSAIQLTAPVDLTSLYETQLLQLEEELAALSDLLAE